MKEIFEFYPVSARVIFGVIYFLLGSGTASFLGVVVGRTIKNQGWTTGRSKCEDCEHVLGWYDLIPVISQICLGSKCRYCKKHFSWGYIIPEIILGLIFAFGGITITSVPQLAIYFLLCGTLMLVSLFDFKIGEVADEPSIFIAILGLITFVFSFFNPTIVDKYGYVWYEHLIGAGLISIPFLILYFFNAMGLADVFLMAAAGFLLSYGIVPAAVIGVFLGAIEGTIIKTFKLKEPDAPGVKVLRDKLEALESESVGEKISPSEFIEKEKQKEQQIKEITDALKEYEDFKPKHGTTFRFVPALSAGIFIAYLYGGEIIDWYLKTFLGK